MELIPTSGVETLLPARSTAIPVTELEAPSVLKLPTTNTGEPGRFAAVDRAVRRASSITARPGRSSSLPIDYNLQLRLSFAWLSGFAEDRPGELRGGADVGTQHERRPSTDALERHRVAVEVPAGGRRARRGLG